MAEVTRWFLLYTKVALPVTVLIGVVLLLIPLFGRIYAANWRYWVWLLLLVRLLIPFSPEISAAPVSIPVAATSYPAERNVLGYRRTPSQPPSAMTQSDRDDSNLQAAAAASVSPLAIAVWVWIAGVFLLLAFHTFHYVRFWRLWNKRIPLTEPSDTLYKLWKQAGKEAGIRRLPELYISPAVPSPVLTGLLRPALLLPHQGFSESHAGLIFRHELEHHRRHDLWYLSAMLLARCLHWYNPVVHLMGQQAARDIELSCDDAVSAGMDRTMRGAYGAAILSALPEKGRVTPMFTTSFISAKRQIKGRLKNLFDLEAKRRGRASLAAVVLLSIAAGSLVTWMPVSAANDPPAGNNAETPSAKPVQSAHSTGAISVAVDHIPAGQAVCVGKMTLDGSTIVYDVTARSGDSIFIAFAETDAISDSSTAKWRNLITNGRDKLAVQSSFQNSMITGEYYVYVGNEGSAPLTGVAGTVYQKGAADSDEWVKLKSFAPYGVQWDAANERLYHNGERVRLFVSFRNDGSFHICWQDPGTDSEQYLVGLLDAGGNPAGVRELDRAIAKELLEEMATAYAVDKPAGSNKTEEPRFLTMDATSTHGNDEIVATDKDMRKENVPENIRNWTARCDQAAGAFLLQQIRENGRHTFYLYYNGGGRYPWNFTTEGDTVTFHLYSDTDMTTGDGYHLMRIDAGGGWNIAATLDGAPLQFRIA